MRDHRVQEVVGSAIGGELHRTARIVATKAAQVGIVARNEVVSLIVVLRPNGTAGLDIRPGNVVDLLDPPQPEAPPPIEAPPEGADDDG